MTGYSRKWTCEVCGEREESVDYPRLSVCGRCSGEGRAARDLHLGPDLERALRAAYERGFRHGRRPQGQGQLEEAA